MPRLRLWASVWSSNGPLGVSGLFLFPLDRFLYSGSSALVCCPLKPGLGAELEVRRPLLLEAESWETWTEKCGLQSVGSHRVGHYWATNTFTPTHPRIHLRGKSQQMKKLDPLSSEDAGALDLGRGLALWAELETSGSCTFLKVKVKLLSHLRLCDPPNCSRPGSALHGDSPGKGTGVGCHFLVQGIFPTQGSNPGPLHCTQTLYPLSHQDYLF